MKIARKTTPLFAGTRLTPATLAGQTPLLQEVAMRLQKMFWLIFFVTLTAAAAAQQTTSPTGSAHQATPARPSAPTGHRQPKMSDLPSALAQKETQSAPSSEPDNRRSQSPIDERLRICRGC